ncbi:hypothetical protein [Marininema halotolerans]|uniref:Uncharacterized protein n=1 Tax=Marininema halotolerans TaxID=1155944 RepID=A0A1I6PTM9_9BACL|nr:hypothetical protein [Marininema halotolerans]SFS43579.1 hypothetical protein SAMN05444972_102125 [Marininema halotolerans]
MFDLEEGKPLSEGLHEDFDGEINPDLESQPEALSKRSFDQRNKWKDLI